jgi:bifunctional ADP-heptose synthase (sugar kinase/adenylyltransferase)
VVGEDYSGDALLNFFRERKIELSGILRIKNWSTPTKTRFLAGWAHTIGQQVLRVDREPATPLPDATREKLSKKLRSLLREADALAV